MMYNAELRKLKSVRMKFLYFIRSDLRGYDEDLSEIVTRWSAIIDNMSMEQKRVANEVEERKKRKGVSRNYKRGYKIVAIV